MRIVGIGTSSPPLYDPATGVTMPGFVDPTDYDTQMGCRSDVYDPGSGICLPAGSPVPLHTGEITGARIVDWKFLDGINWMLVAGLILGAYILSKQMSGGSGSGKRRRK